MGMDVYGKKPKSKEGEYFRRNVWGWRPLWDYCVIVYKPAQSVLGQTNDGDGLDERQSLGLAEVLETRLQSGNVKAYVTTRDTNLAALPLEECKHCQGTGKRNYDTDPHLQHMRDKGHKGEFECNACHGKGQVKSFETWYHLDEDDVREFVQFLKNCGGFSIC